MKTFNFSFLVTFFVFALYAQKSFSEVVQRPNLFSLTPPAQKVGEYNFPRNGLTLYHGTKAEFVTLEDAIRSLFRDKEVAVESPLLGVARLQLFQKPIPQKFPDFDEWKKVKAQLDLVSTPNTLSKDEAQRIALPIVNRVVSEDFFSGLIEKFLDYNEDRKQPTYKTHEDYTGIIYTSIFQPSAAGYGDRVVVIEEKNQVSLDSNFFNFVRNGKWLGDGNLRPFESSYLIGDAGEFATATYVPSNDMVGYQVRQSYPTRDWNIHAIAPILYALYRYDLTPKKSLILIVDGYDSDKNSQGQCLWRDSNKLSHTYQQIFHCQYKSTHSGFTIQERAKILGVIQKCYRDCLVPSEVKQKFLPSSTKIDPELISTLNQLTKYKMTPFMSTGINPL